MPSVIEKARDEDIKADLLYAAKSLALEEIYAA
jgi:hypothetical protein